jgi:hypothetical protein
MFFQNLRKKLLKIGQKKIYFFFALLKIAALKKEFKNKIINTI